MVNEGFINEVKWITALLSTEGEARMDNDALEPRLQWKVTTFRVDKLNLSPKKVCNKCIIQGNVVHFYATVDKAFITHVIN